MSGPKPKYPRQKAEAQVKGSSQEAKRTAGVLLEVLAGTMLPSEAASALGISRARYYLLESRALAGLVKACEPRPAGYVHTPERELAALKKAHARLERECARYQTLVRAMQRSVGLSLPAKHQRKAKGDKKGTRRRKPTVRALVLSEKLKNQTADKSPTDDGSSKAKHQDQQQAKQTGTP
jgi:hypothetical protein